MGSSLGSAAISACLRLLLAQRTRDPKRVLARAKEPVGGAQWWSQEDAELGACRATGSAQCPSSVGAWLGRGALCHRRSCGGLCALVGLRESPGAGVVERAARRASKEGYDETGSAREAGAHAALAPFPRGRPRPQTHLALHFSDPAKDLQECALVIGSACSERRRCG